MGEDLGGIVDTARIDRFLTERGPPTPCVVIDIERVRAQYQALQALFPSATIFYAVKANPAPAVICALAELGASFDLASAGEIARCRGVGVAPARLSFGNTIKRETVITEAHRGGIDLFAFDSRAELEKLSRAAPGSRVFCRLRVSGKGAEWPLTHKFGCAEPMAIELLLAARKLGLRPAGVSFHVGSQQTDPMLWRGAIAEAAKVFRSCTRAGIDLDLLNVGGGFPAHYRSPVPPVEAYTDAIDGALAEHFGGSRPRLLVEPGRYMVGDAGLLRSEVLLTARKSRDASRRWVYIDAGRFNGLPETLGEHIRYRIRTPHDGRAYESAILAGPTCDSADIIYQRPDFRLPVGLAIGDPVDFLSAGAYTASYAAVEFNGFPPIQTYCI